LLDVLFLVVDSTKICHILKKKIALGLVFRLVVQCV